MLTIAVINLKGGTSKTTTSAYLAHALHEAGLAVLGVDADGENQSLLHWQQAAQWPFPVIGMPVANLHKTLPGIVADKYDAVVIDTPPLRENRGVVLSSARLASHIVCPIAPTPMEYERAPAVRSLLDEATELREEAPQFAVLFTRTVANATSTDVYRQIVAEDGLHVLKPTVGRLERYALAYGQPIVNAANTAYGDALNELLDMGASA